jgi:hypothetical protein
MKNAFTVKYSVVTVTKQVLIVIVNIAIAVFILLNGWIMRE